MTNLLQGYQDVKQAVVSYVQTNGNAMCAEIFEKAFAANPDVKMLVVNGYTPGFNDGEPCTHSQYTVCSGEELQSSILECEHFTETAAKALGAPDDEDSYVDPFEFIEEYEFKDIHYQESNKVSNVVDEFVDLLEDMYGTGWQLLVIKNDDGTITVEFNADYDCGY